MLAGSAVGVQGVAGAGPAVAHEVGLGVHCDCRVWCWGFDVRRLVLGFEDWAVMRDRRG